MKRVLSVAALCAGAMALQQSTSAALPTGYQFDITTSYSSSRPADLAPGAPVGAPDTGYLQVKNNGSTTFTGLLDLLGVVPGGGPTFDFNIPSITLSPGDSISLSLNDESSNHGGYGDAGAGNPQFGAQFTMNGSVTDGIDTEFVLLQVFDRDIHSGFPRTNPFGNTTDAYVLQGGDPFGLDTGDPYETTQAPGHYQFFEAGPAGVPDAGSTFLLLGATLGALRLIRKKR